MNARQQKHRAHKLAQLNVHRQFLCRLFNQDDVLGFEDLASHTIIVMDFSQAKTREELALFEQFRTFVIGSGREQEVFHTNHKFVLEGRFLKRDDKAIFLDGLDPEARWFVLDE